MNPFGVWSKAERFDGIGRVEQHPVSRNRCGKVNRDSVAQPGGGEPRGGMGLGAEVEGQVERVNGGSILGQSQMTQLWMVAQEVDHLSTARAQLLRGLSVGQDDRLSLLRHFQNPAVIVWPHRIFDLQQAVFVGGTVGVDVPD